MKVNSSPPCLDIRHGYRLSYLELASLNRGVRCRTLLVHSVSVSPASETYHSVDERVGVNFFPVFQCILGLEEHHLGTARDGTTRT